MPPPRRNRGVPGTGFKVKVGEFTNVPGGPVEHLVIRTTDGKDIGFRYGFWLAVGGTSRFAIIVQRFVKDVEDDVEFV